MKRAVKPLRFAAFAEQTEIGGGFSRRIGRALRIAPLALCAAAGMVFANAAFADTNLTENVVLTEDTDWRSLGTVTIPDGVGVHLNGHKLYVAGFTGAGSIYTSVIPSDYVELEYIETSGSQYIDTGINRPDENAMKVDAEIAALDGIADYAPLICASALNNDNTDNALCYGVWVWPNSGKKWSVFVNGKRRNSSASVSIGQKINLVATWSSSAMTLQVDGVSKLNQAENFGSSLTSSTMSIPGWKCGSTMRNLSGAKFRIYSFKIYKPQDTLVRDYVPVRRKSDGAVGLYDRKNGTFSPSATETPFIEGNELGSTLGGELHIDVASGTFNNSTVAISNAVRVVKDGVGTYVSQKGQTYSGGTVVSAGRVQINGITSTSSVLHGFGAVGSDVVVASNAQVVIAGVYQTLSGYNVTIAGDGPDNNGAIYGNAKHYASWNSAFLKSLTLAGDASIKVVVEDSFNLRSGDDSTTTDISLCGHRLTVNGSARFIVYKANVTDVGRIVSSIAPGSDLSQNKNFYVSQEMSAPLVDFEVAQGGALGGDGPVAIVVSNMTFAGTWTPANAQKSVTVLGCYSPKPTAVNWPTLTLGDSEHLSPTLDLSALSSAYNGSALSFAEGATISVTLGDRQIPSNSQLVSWTTEPANRFVRGDSGADGSLEKKSDGLYFVRRGLSIFVR